MADVCARVGTAADAARLHALLQPATDLCACEEVLVSFGSVQRALGELAHRSGDHALAERYLRQALAMNEVAQHRPERARTLFALGRVLQRLGRATEAELVSTQASTEANAMKMAAAS